MMKVLTLIQVVIVLYTEHTDRVNCERQACIDTDQVPEVVEVDVIHLDL
jgi:hypothetical protein